MSSKRCCVPNCTQAVETHEVLHLFPNPNKDLERFNIWISTIGGEILSLSQDYIYKHRRVCHSHFEQKYCCRNFRISNIAVPTLLLPSTLQDTTSEITLKEIQNLPSTLQARCKCCLNEDDLKNLWEPYIYEEETEIYGEMLSECFAFSWNQPEEHLKCMEMICNSCIKRLRDAFSFRREVMASEEVLREHEDKMLLYTTLRTENEMQLEKETDYEEIEYLDITEESIKEQSSDDDSSNYELQISEKQITEETERKWPKKLPKIDRNKTYKQYTVNALKMAIDAVLSNKMSTSCASKTYGVPRKTITAKLHTGILKKEEMDDDAIKLYEQDKHHKLVEEIKTILIYTNAIPYKSKASKYYCAYCIDGPGFDDGDDLRTHTRTQHVDQRTTSIEQMMRPQWLNEVLKLDIHSLHCTVCCTVIPTWNDMFRHLEEIHQVALDEAYSKVIPFVLSRELSCALCGESFSNYHNLDGHMNAHYSSYICYECGDTFLAASRLNKHIEVHKFGEYPCPACGKVFKLKKYMRKHFDLIHSSERKIKCHYCSERFFGLFARQQHIVKMHKERVKIITCEICGKTFDWRPYYTTHMRRIHGTEKNHKCKECGKMFLMKYELKNHKVKHETQKKFICDVCCKGFKSKLGFLRHQQMHWEPVSKDTVKASNKVIREV